MFALPFHIDCLGHLSVPIFRVYFDDTVLYIRSSVSRSPIDNIAFVHVIGLHCGVTIEMANGNVIDRAIVKHTLRKL